MSSFARICKNLNKPCGLKDNSKIVVDECTRHVLVEISYWCKTKYFLYIYMGSFNPKKNTMCVFVISLVLSKIDILTNQIRVLVLSSCVMYSKITIQTWFFSETHQNVKIFLSKIRTKKKDKHYNWGWSTVVHKNKTLANFCKYSVTFRYFDILTSHKLYYI